MEGHIGIIWKASGDIEKRQRIANGVCGTLKCENAAICEKVAKYEKYQR